MRVSMTGATGFVGSYTIQSLLETDHQLRALVRPSTDASWLEESGVEICRGAMTDELSLRSLVDGAEVLIHTAYESNPSEEENNLDYFRSNIFGSLTLLELAYQARVRQFICTSSTYILRPDVNNPREVNNASIDEDSSWVPASSRYLLHNAVLESGCQTYFRQFGINTTCFRCAWIYGIHPNLERTVWRDIIEHTRSGERYESKFGCDVVAVEDVALTLTASVGHPKAFGQVFNLAEMFVYNQELAQIAWSVTGNQAKVPEQGLPKPKPISSERIKSLGINFHRGAEGIHTYFKRLNQLI